MITTGKMLDKGEGTARDSKQAFYWFSKAAEKGSPEAEVSWANCIMPDVAFPLT